MSRPTWATVVGVLAIVFGAFSVLGGAQEMTMPAVLEMQQAVMDGFSAKQTASGEEFPKISWQIEQGGQTEKIELGQMFETMQQQFQVPEWYSSWAMAIGIVSMLSGALYLMSGIFLISVKPFAIKLFYVALGVSILWAIIQSVLYAQSASGLLLAQIPGAIFSIVIDIVLLIVVLTSNKEAYSLKHEPEEILFDC